MDRMLALRMGRPDMAGGTTDDAVISNAAFVAKNAGSPNVNMDDVPASTGVLGLSMLSVLIIGVMVYYVATRSKQL